MKKQNVRKHSPIHPSIKVLSLILGVLLFFSACPPISFALNRELTTQGVSHLNPLLEQSQPEQ